MILDGAVGTELEALDLPLPAPLWSAAALLDETGRAALSGVHRAHVEAGAEILVTCTFRTTRRSVKGTGLTATAAAEVAGELTAEAVNLARAAAAGSALVAGSMAPLEDCWRPDLMPPTVERQAEHAEHAANLAAAGCDLLLAETHHTIAELVDTVAGAAATGLPVWAAVSVADGRLRSGEDPVEALQAAVAAGASAILINCSSTAEILALAPRLAAMGVPWGAMPNHGNDGGTGQWRPGDTDHHVLAATGATLRAAGATLLGGCCGTTPDHVADLARALDAAPK